MARILESGAAALLALALAACVSRPTWRGDEGTAYDILNRSTLAILDIDRDGLDGPFGSAARRACAVFVFPGSSIGVPASAAARGNGVLLARDPSSGHWSGPAFYALRIHDADDREHPDQRAWVITVGCKALSHLYARSGPSRGDTPTESEEVDEAIKDDMAAWSLTGRRPVQVSLDDIALRPLPIIALAYYQAPASLQAVLVDRTVRNDASVEIQAAIERVAD